jgi:hypothetical protein
MSEEQAGGQIPARLSVFDARLAKLKDAFPGWRIWYVPGFDGRQRTIRWCAQRHPLLNCDSPETLGDAMLDVDEHYSSGPYESDETGWLPRRIGRARTD